MILSVSAVSMVLYLIILCAYNSKPIQQQIAFLAVFLAGTAVVGELDILLPIYFVASFLPFLSKLRKCSVLVLSIAFYMIIYFAIGFLYQNPTRSIVTFISRIWQFVIFFIICDEKIEINETDYKPTIWFVMVLETVLGLYLMRTSNIVDSLNGLVRLVNNGQPITGNMSTVLLPLSALYYAKNRGNARNSKFLLVASLFMLIWIVLSGTRGYVLEFIAVMGFIFFVYFTIRRVSGTTRRNRILTIGAILIIAVGLVVIVPNLLEKATSVLRLNSTVGIRTYENAAVRDYLGDATIIELLFGIGLGGKAYDHEAMRNALNKQFNLGMWHSNHYMTESGTLFHSLYANIVLCLGIIGLIFVLVFFIKMWKKISLVCDNDIFMRRVLHFYQISFFLMNYYRWSADCGITEMIILALVLKIVETQNAESQEQQSVKEESTMKLMRGETA